MEPLSAWLRAQNIWCDPRLQWIRIDENEDRERTSALGTLAVVARASILPEAIVARIPCSALLCVANCALYQMELCKKAVSACKPSLCLALCVLYEQSLKSLSKFDVYLRHCTPVSLPATDKTWENDPFFTHTEAWYRLQRRGQAFQNTWDYPGTCEVRSQGLTQMELSHFWHTWALPILEQALDTTPSYAKFLSAFSLVSSRAFIIDIFHG